MEGHYKVTGQKVWTKTEVENFGPSVELVTPPSTPRLNRSQSEPVKTKYQVTHLKILYQYYQSPYNHLCNVSAVAFHLSDYTASYFLL